MKMKLQDLQILARTECMILWDRLAETGDNNKYDVIANLYIESKLLDDYYDCNCPFCEYLRNDNDTYQCINCIWPGFKTSPVRCELSDSPFYKWRKSKTKKDRIKYAKMVFNLIENAKITKSNKMIEIYD
jgi:hypothetical protein